MTGLSPATATFLCLDFTAIRQYAPATFMAQTPGKSPVLSVGLTQLAWIECDDVWPNGSLKVNRRKAPAEFVNRHAPRRLDLRPYFGSVMATIFHWPRCLARSANIVSFGFSPARIRSSNFRCSEFIWARISGVGG